MTPASDDANFQDPVARQFAAFNARDIDAFIEAWAPDCRVYAFPERLLHTGIAEVRALCLQQFKEPNLHASLRRRSSVENIIADHLSVARTLPEGRSEMDALIVYDVESGRIARCWVKLGAPRLLRRLDVTIRQATIDDAALLHTLTRAAYSKWVARLGREPKPMAVDYVEAFGRHHFAVAMAGGVAVGLVELAIEHDHVLVVNVAVAPELHGRGVGRMLLKHAEIVALGNGRRNLRLYTNKLFTENIALYQKEGYVVDREEAFLGGATVHLLKRI